MRQKLPCLLLSGALILILCACSSGGEFSSPGQTPSRPVETDAPSEASPVQSAEPSQPVESVPPSAVLSLPPEPADVSTDEHDLPGREYQPWQTAYMDFLTGLLQAEQDTGDRAVAFARLGVADERGVTAGWSLYEEPPLAMTAVMDMGSENYSLYDVDGDGVPELFVKYGDCEAAYTTQCYTCRDGQVACIGEFRSGHSGLFTCPGKSAVLRTEAHMGYLEIYEYPMEGGRLIEERVLFTEEDVQDYTQTAEIVPGAEYIQTYYTRAGMEDDSYWTGQVPYSLGEALLLPICDYYDGPAATGSSSERARTAILAALNGEGELYGASGDHFYGDVGWMSWEEYIQPESAYPYNEKPLEIERYVWLDMNGDGQEECMLRLTAFCGETDGVPWINAVTVVLSEQDGAVYAYLFGFYDNADAFYNDGTMRQYGEDRRLSFWKGQCYEYTAQRDPSGQPVKWLDGSPAGGN